VPWAAWPSRQGSADQDPLLGKWKGMVGPPARERVEVGLEFRKAAGGGVELRLTQPIVNTFDVGDPGLVVVRSTAEGGGERIVVEGVFLDLVLRDGKLEGFFPGPSSPATFARATELPREAPIPQVQAGPPVRWQIRLSGQVFATPATFDGVVYVGSTGGVFDAVRAGDGERLWTFAAGRPIYGEAAVDRDSVYFVCDNGYLFKLERETGKEVWRFDLGDGRVSRVTAHPAVFDWDWQAPRPILADGAVYVGAGDGTFHAVDAVSGRSKWRFATAGRLRNTAVAFGDASSPRVAFGGGDHFVHVLDRRDGREIWRHDTGAEIDTAAVFDGARILVGNRGYGLFALAAETGELEWRNFFWGSWVESTPVLADGLIYVGSSDLRRVSAIDPADGRVIWRSDVFGWTWGTPLVVGDRIYAGAAGGTPYFIRHVASFTTLERATGRMLARRPLAEVAGAHQWGIAGSPVFVPAAGGVPPLVVYGTIEGGLAATEIVSTAGSAASSASAVSGGRR
jgi:outer membrane protein assembly factor BamB